MSPRLRKLTRMRVPHSRRPVSKQRGRLFMVTIGLIAVVIALAMVWVGYHAPTSIPSRSYYTLHANIKDAANIQQHDQVRARGQNVGQVLHPRAVHGHAVVDLQLDPSIGPLRSDTTLRVRPRSAVGVRFIELTPGEHGRILPSGSTLPMSQTTASVDLFTALKTFDSKRRAEAQTMLNELGEGFHDSGQDVNRTLGAAPDLLRRGASVSDAIVGRTGAVRSFIQGARGAANAADPVREDIATGFAPEAAALRPFATHGASVRNTLAAAPPALAALSTQLPRTDPVLEQVDGLARQALPALKAAPGTFTQASALFLEARQGLTDARKTLALAQQAVAPTLDALDLVQPILPDLESTLSNTFSILGELGPRGCDIHNWAENWVDLVGLGDHSGNYLRFDLVPSPQSLGGQSSKLPVGAGQDPYPAPCAAANQRLAK